MSMTTIKPGDALLRTLAHFTHRDHAGRHFTERYAAADLAALESAGLLAIDRPVHDATGLPYGEEHWHAAVTEAGRTLAERLYDERDYEIEDGVYFLNPDGGGWQAVWFRGGRPVGWAEESEAATHDAAGDSWAGVAPGDGEVEVSAAVARDILRLVMPDASPEFVVVTRMGG